MHQTAESRGCFFVSLPPPFFNMIIIGSVKQSSFSVCKKPVMMVLNLERSRRQNLISSAVARAPFPQQPLNADLRQIPCLELQGFVTALSVVSGPLWCPWVLVQQICGKSRQGLLRIRS